MKQIEKGRKERKEINSVKILEGFDAFLGSKCDSFSELCLLTPTFFWLPKIIYQGVGHILLIFLNFHQILHRFTLNIANTSFQGLKASNNEYKNVKPQICQSAALVFSNLDSQTTFYYAHDKRCVISHWMTALKNRGKCELPRFIGSKESCPPLLQFTLPLLLPSYLLPQYLAFFNLPNHLKWDRINGSTSDAR